MKTIFLALLLSICVVARGSDITYNLVNYPADQDSVYGSGPAPQASLLALFD